MTSAQRRTLLVAILASFVSFLDGSVVNVALPAISTELAGGSLGRLALQQWTVDAYLITLGSLILVSGSLSDVYGRRRVMHWGLIGFLVTSILATVAPTGEFLIAARALQGVAGALLVPSSLAMIISAFDGEAQGKAIGTWTAWTGTAMIAGPVLGGVFVDTLSWRWVFAINVLPIVVTLWMLRGVTEGVATTGRRVDFVGATLAAIGLAGPVFALIEQGRFGMGSPVVWGPLAVGIVALVLFFAWEKRAQDPMLPLSFFRLRNFTFGNLATAAIYGALSFGGFAIALFVQQVAGYSATAAGLAMLPVTLIMLVMSSRFGALAGRYGPRIFMTVGPILAGCGYLLMCFSTAEANYLSQLLPGILLFGVGLAITVSPLTVAILGSIPAKDAGIGSAVNNAVSRIAGLIVIACAGLIIGPTVTVDGFHRAMFASGLLLILGGAVSWVGIRNGQRNQQGNDS